MSAERTAKAIVAGTWGCAAIVMVASAANAALTYGALGDNRALGLATGIAVDISLCVGLIGDRRLYAHGLSSTWGRVLRITTAVMSLILNTGISLREGHYFQALLHSFLPVLLIVLCEYGQDVLLRLTALAREQAAEQMPEQPAQMPAVLPARDGLDLFVPPPRVGPIDVPQAGPQAGPIVPPKPAREPARADLPKPAREPARRQPARTSPSSKRAGAAGRTDEQLVQAARDLAGRSDGPLTQYAVRQAFGLGSARAARLLEQLDPVPAGPARSNGRAQLKEVK